MTYILEALGSFLFVLIFVLAIISFLIWEQIDKFWQTLRGYYITSRGDGETNFMYYWEGKSSILFIGPKIRGPESNWIIYIPSPAQWKRNMPEWAQNRREEIMDRIRTHYRKGVYVFQELED